MKDTFIQNIQPILLRPCPTLSVEVDTVSATGVAIKQITLEELRGLISQNGVGDIVPAILDSEKNQITTFTPQ